MLLSSIEVKQAEKIASEFLRQKYSNIIVEKSVLEDDGRVWLVEVSVSLFDKEKKITVRVNARTGSILGWE
jgi:uncharacterized membrane protein YkoI